MKWKRTFCSITSKGRWRCRWLLACPNRLWQFPPLSTISASVPSCTACNTFPTDANPSRHLQITFIHILDHTAQRHIFKQRFVVTCFTENHITSCECVRRENILTGRSRRATNKSTRYDAFDSSTRESKRTGTRRQLTYLTSPPTSAWPTPISWRWAVPTATCIRQRYRFAGRSRCCPGPSTLWTWENRAPWTPTAS